MLQISSGISIPDDEIELSAIRAQGSGGQNVNKVSSAIHLRFDIKTSSLPDFHKQRLLTLNDSRISKDGVIVIKAQQFRTQEKNREAALQRLQALIKDACVVKKARKETLPSKNARRKRVEDKVHRGRTKLLRRKIDSE